MLFYCLSEKWRQQIYIFMFIIQKIYIIFITWVLFIPWLPEDEMITVSIYITKHKTVSKISTDVQFIMTAEGPTTRQASLQRYLEKRKDR